MDKKAIMLKIIGLVLMLVPFLYNNYTMIRIISVLIGLTIFIIGILINKKKNVFKVVLLILINLGILFGIDYFLTRYFNRVPIFSYEIKSSTKFSTYNSFFYRVYNCNKDTTFDLFYKKNYVCDITLPEENINSLLPHMINNFRDYKNKFVNVNGKISRISGSSSIEMQVFEVADNSINGQVNFSNDITLVIQNAGNIEKIEDLKIYDKINVIGRISAIKNNGQNKEIIMKDAKIISRNNFANYEINVIQNKSCTTDLKLMSKAEDYTYYNNCLESIYIKYDEENIYDLGYVLTDKRMTFEMLTKDSSKEENENVELYKYSDFNLLKCKNSNNIIIGNKNLNLDTNYCENFANYEENENLEGIS